MEMTFLFKILLSLTLCLLWPAACLPRPPETKAVDRPMVEAYDAWASTKSHLSPLTKVPPLWDASVRKDGDKAESDPRQSSLSKYYFMADAKPELMPVINPEEMPGTRPENMPLAKPQDMFRSMDGNMPKRGPEELTMLKSSIKFPMAEKAMLESSERQKIMQRKAMLDKKESLKMMAEKAMLGNSERPIMMAEKAMLDNSERQFMMAEKVKLDSRERQKMMLMKAMLDNKESQKMMAEKATLDSRERQKMMQEKMDTVSSNVPGPKTPDTPAGKLPQTSMKKSFEDQMSKPEKKIKDKHFSKMPMNKPSAMPMAEPNKTVDQFSRRKLMSKPKDMQLAKNKSWEKSLLMKDLNEKKEESPKISLTQMNKSNSVSVPESLALAIPAIKSHAPADPLPKEKLKTSDDISPKPSTKSPLTEDKSTLKYSLPPNHQLKTDSLSKSDEKSSETVFDKLSGLQNLPEFPNEDRILQKMKTENLLTQMLAKTDTEKLPALDEFQELQQAQKTKQLPQEPLKEDTHTFLSEKKMATLVQTEPKQTVDKLELKSPSSSTSQPHLSEKPEWQLHGLRTRREAQQRRSGKMKASGSGGRVPMYRMMKAMMGGDGKVAEQRRGDRGDDVNQKKAGSKGSAMGPKLMQNMMGEDFRKISHIMDSKSGPQPMKEMMGDKIDPQKMREMMGEDHSSKMRERMGEDYSSKMREMMGEDYSSKMREMMGGDYSSKMREMMGDKMGPRTANEMMGKEFSKSLDEMMEKHPSKMLEKMVNGMGLKEMKEMMEKEFSGKLPSSNIETMEKIMGEEFSKKMIEMMHAKMDPATSKNKITLEKLVAMMSEMMDNKEKFEAMKAMMAEMMDGKEKFESMKAMMAKMMGDEEKFEAMKAMMAEMMGGKEKFEAMKAMMDSETGLAKIKDLMAGHPGQETFEIMSRMIGLAKMKETMNSEKGQNISEVMNISKIHEKENSLKGEVKQNTSEPVSDKDVKLSDNQILATLKGAELEDNQTLTTQSPSLVTTSLIMTPLPDLARKTEVTKATSGPGLRQPDTEPGHKATEDGARKTAEKNSPAKDKEKTDLMVKKTRKMEWTTSTMTSNDKRRAAVKEASVKNKFLTRFHWPSQVPGSMAGRDSFTGEFEEGEI